MSSAPALAPATTPSPTMPGWLRAGFEVLLVLALWVVYSLARLLADTDMGPAVDRAHELLQFEQGLGIHWEVPLNQLFSDYQVIGLAGSYWYASLHYVVTVAVLVWLWRLGADRYGPARRALVIGTLIGLACYISLPTAPPRFISGYVDVLKLHAADGWWGADASAPRGLGGLTNELAAFPSLHAGWALWVALALQLYATRHWVRVLGWVYAVGTTVVIVGTGNHWVVDAVAGWLAILAGWAAARAIGRIPLSRLWPDRLRDRLRPDPIPAARRVDARPAVREDTVPD
ncbi:MAG: phosphatase PAP2 family protein [Nocardioides sp.]